MLVTLIIFLGLSPGLVALWMMQRVQAQAQARLQHAANLATMQQVSPQREAEYQYVEGIGYIIGDLSCRFNARSSYVRCAVNPYGPCHSCSCYEAR